MPNPTASALAYAGRAFLDTYAATGDHAAAMRTALRMLEAGEKPAEELSGWSRCQRAADIVWLFAQQRDITVTRLLGRLRSPRLDAIRRELVWLLYQVPGIKGHDVAEIMKRDRTSMIAARDHFASLLRNDEVLRARMARVVDAIRGSDPTKETPCSMSS